MCYALEDKMEYLKQISQTFLGSQLTEDEINTALHNRNFRIMHFNKNELLHLEGDDCFNLEILLIGNIVNMHVDQYGNRLIIENFESNEILAGNILFGSFPKYPLSFFAQSHGTLLQINKAYLFELFTKKPIILRQFLMLISDRAINLGQIIKLGKRKPLRDLITEYLHLQSLLQNSTTITLPISKSDLATKFGVQRTSVSREFSRMEKDGLLTLYSDNKTIKILPTTTF